MSIWILGARWIGALAFVLLSFPAISYAACDETITFAGSPDYRLITGTCASQAEAFQACEVVRIQRNYPEGQCRIGGNADGESFVYSGGWLWDNFNVSTLPMTNAAYYYQYTAKADPNKNIGACPFCFGDPVNAGTGNKFETQIEFEGAGDFPVSLSWTYNSVGTPSYLPVQALIFGRNRTYEYSERVVNIPKIPTPTAYVTRADGKALHFRSIGGNWVADAGIEARLSSATDTGGAIVGWELDDGNGQRQVFNAAGRLLGVYDRSGRSHVLGYDSQSRLSTITDSSNRSIALVYNASNLVKEAKLPDGTSLFFYYSNGGDLIRTEYPGGISKQYLYDESGLVAGGTPPGSLTGVIDEAQARYSTTAYQGPRATSTNLAGGKDAYAATYQVAANGTYATQTTIALPNGSTRQAAFTVVNGKVLPSSITTTCTGCQAQTTTKTYDPNGRPDLVTDKGVMVDYDYNGDGLLVQRIDAANDVTSKKRTTQTDWHADHREPTEQRVIDAVGNLVGKQTWTYNARGQVLTHAVIEP